MDTQEECLCMTCMIYCSADCGVKTIPASGIHSSSQLTSPCHSSHYAPPFQALMSGQYQNISRSFPPAKLGRMPIIAGPLAFVSPSTIHPLLLLPLPDLVPEISSYSAISSRIKHGVMRIGIPATSLPHTFLIVFVDTATSHRCSIHS
jgi:hypothetical protein